MVRLFQTQGVSKQRGLAVHPSSYTSTLSANMTEQRKEMVDYDDILLNTDNNRYCKPVITDNH